MKGPQHEGTVYLDDQATLSSHVRVRRAHTNFHIVKMVTSIFLALAVLLGGAASTGVLEAVAQSHVQADDDDDAKDDIKDKADDYGAGDDEKGFEGAIDKYNKNDSPKENSFGYVIKRLFSIDYMNRAPKAEPPDGYDKAPYTGTKSNGDTDDNALNCKTDAKGHDTPYYHNCDVPNIVTEFVQDTADLFITDGAANAAKTDAKVDSQWFGLPSTMPKGGASVDDSQRDNKFTGLELFGYNQKYTMYKGEWDHLKVYTSARALANYGFMDHLKLGAKSILNGVVGGMKEGAANAADDLKQGDVLGAVGSAFSGFFGGGSSASINTYIDSSDQNVFNTQSWYRTNYGKTLYNARELTEAEKATLQKDMLYKAVQDKSEGEIKLPKKFRNLKGGPPKPQEDVSQCRIKDSDGDMTEYDNDKHKSGVTKSECKKQSKKKNKDDPKYKWSKDGNHEQDSLGKWKRANQDWFSNAKKYGLSCSIDGSTEKKRQERLDKFYSCIPDKYNAAAKKQNSKLKKDKVKDFSDHAFDADYIKDYMHDHKELNPNASWNQYVCTNKDGTDDLKENGDFKFVMNSKGEYTGNCGPVRPPIQNGMFGNGYETGGKKDYVQKQPETDTRRDQLDTSFVGVLFPVDSMINSVADAELGLTKFMTRASNSVLNLSFSPILKTLGVDKIVVSLIKDFRDSIFFPFAYMLAAGGALYIFAMGFRQRNYVNTFKSFAMIVFTIFTGSLLMFKPQMVMDFVDKGPAKIETTIVGSIFGVQGDSDDQLCTSSGGESGKKKEGLDGDQMSASPKDSTRSMLCENWRIFTFNPWVFGQWGTNFHNLYTQDSGKENHLNNSAHNEKLVGDAPVQMGDNTEVNNWALYQLKTTSSGTSTNRHNTGDVGRVDHNFYRMVDAQAGPHNGEGTDSRYFQAWSGKDFGNRISVATMGSISSIVGFITVMIYSLNKIIITFLSALLLLALPFMFLLGVVPNVGQSKLREYVGTLAGLMVQRVMLVSLLAVMMRALVSAANASENFLIITVVTIATCSAFIMYRKQVLDMIMRAMTRGTGGRGFGGGWGSSPKKSGQEFYRKNAPRSLRNYTSFGANAMRSGMTGAVGGFVAGGIRGAGSGAKENVNVERRQLYRRQRAEGFGATQSAQYAARSAQRDVAKRVTKSSQYPSVNQDVDHNVSSEMSARGKPQEGQKMKGASISAQRTDNSKNLRSMSKLTRSQEKMAQVQQKRDQTVSHRKSRRMQKEGGADINRIKEHQDQVTKKKAKSEPKDIKRQSKLQHRYDTAMNKLTHDEANRAQKDKRTRKYKDSMNNLRDQFDNSGSGEQSHGTDNGDSTGDE